MAFYLVKIPITGILQIEVESDSEEEAVSKAFEEATLDNVEEWEMHSQIVKGNVFYGVQNEIEVADVSKWYEQD